MKNNIKRLWRENKSFVLLIVLMVIFRSSFADWNVVPTGSMKPTILEGDRILVNKMSYDLRIPLTHIPIFTLDKPQHGDIVVFDSKASDKRLVKRVIGVPGDVIAMKNNRLIINSIPAEYSNIEYSVNAVYAVENHNGFSHRVKFARGGLSSNGTFGPVSVPKGHYFVLGDNRDESADSRFIGFVPRNEIVGKSASVVMSLDYDNYYLPRSNRFFMRFDA